MAGRIRPWRRFIEAIQAVVILGVPFLRINGESALRFDIPSLRLFFFGLSLSMAEFFIVLVAIIFLSFLIILVTLLFGRVWCGWLCPQTVIVDFTPFADRAPVKGYTYKAASYMATLAVSALVAANLIWYFVSPYEFFRHLADLSLGPVAGGAWLVLTMVIFLDFAFLRHRFCSTVCPYAKLQSVMFDDKTMVIAFDQERKKDCLNCMACVRACPVGMDIRKGMNSACINCAECVDKCSEMMGKRRMAGLLGYRFGTKTGTGRIIRQNAVLVFSFALFFLLMLVYLLETRISFDMTVLPNYRFTPRVSDEGAVVNSYVLSVENRGRSGLDLEVFVSGQNKGAKISPDRISLQEGEHRNVPVYVIIKKEAVGTTRVLVDIRAEASTLKKSITKSAVFIVPEGR